MQSSCNIYISKERRAVGPGLWDLMHRSGTGSLKTFLGLSASIAATIYAGAFTDGLSFLLFLALGPPALGLLMLPLLNHVPYVEDCEVDLSAHKPATGAAC